MSFIFLHIPRTGGMSLRNTMDTVFGRDNVGRPWWGDHAGEPLTEEVRNKKAWYGHFPFGLHEHIGSPVKYVTILREPTERVLSEYARNRYRERYGWTPIDLVRSDDTQAMAMAGNNLMVRLLSGSSKETELTNEHVEIARRNLSEHFMFVGFTHRYKDIEAFLRDNLDWAIRCMPHDNKGCRAAVSNYEVEELRNSPELELDYALWRSLT